MVMEEAGQRPGDIGTVRRPGIITPCLYCGTVGEGHGKAERIIHVKHPFRRADISVKAIPGQDIVFQQDLHQLVDFLGRNDYRAGPAVIRFVFLQFLPVFPIDFRPEQFTSRSAYFIGFIRETDAQGRADGRPFRAVFQAGQICSFGQCLRGCRDLFFLCRGKGNIQPVGIIHTET